MRTKVWIPLGAVVLIGGALLYGASLPQTVALSDLSTHPGDPKNGELLFHAGGCISCHAPAKDAGRDPKLPSGGAP